MENTAIAKVQAVIYAAAICSSPAVVALDFKSDISAGVEYTDNARLSSSNEEDDWITTANLGASLIETGGPLEASVKTSVSYNDYINDTFSEQTYFNLGAVLGWKQIENRLEWQVSDFFSQTPVDSIDPDTPNNLQDTNVFSFGPNINFPVNGRHNFNISPVFRDFYYEDSDTDNQEYGVSAGWYYQMYPTLNVGLSGNVSEVRYEDDNLNPDYTRESYQAVLSGTRLHSAYTLKLGMTKIDRDKFDDQDGASGSFDWLLNLSGRSSLRTFVSSNISDSSSAYYSSSVDPDTGDYTNVQTSGDVLRNSTARITYNRDGDVVKARVWTELRDLDYKESPNDREVMLIGTSINRRVTPTISAGFYGQYDKTKQTDISRTDKSYLVGGKMGFSLSRKVTANLDLQYRNKDSDKAIDEYSAFSIFAGITYGLVGF